MAARGLDVDRIGLVVNYDVPREAEAYVHGLDVRGAPDGRALPLLSLLRGKSVA